MGLGYCNSAVFHLIKKGLVYCSMNDRAEDRYSTNSSRSKSFAICARKKERKEDVLLEMPVHTLF